MELIRFDSDDIANELAELSDEQIQELAFGAIQVDKEGIILSYNAAEGEIAGRDPKEMIGKNFFDDVAPCTKTDDFYGRFKAGAATGELRAMFEYEFDYNMQPTKVRVHMKSGLASNQFWILVKRL